MVLTFDIERMNGDDAQIYTSGTVPAQPSNVGENESDFDANTRIKFEELLLSLAWSVAGMLFAFQVDRKQTRFLRRHRECLHFGLLSSLVFVFPFTPMTQYLFHFLIAVEIKMKLHFRYVKR